MEKDMPRQRGCLQRNLLCTAFLGGFGVVEMLHMACVDTNRKWMLWTSDHNEKRNRMCMNQKISNKVCSWFWMCSRALVYSLYWLLYPKAEVHIGKSQIVLLVRPLFWRRAFTLMLTDAETLLGYGATSILCVLCAGRAKGRSVMYGVSVIPIIY